MSRPETPVPRAPSPLPYRRVGIALLLLAGAPVVGPERLTAQEPRDPAETRPRVEAAAVPGLEEVSLPDGPAGRLVPEFLAAYNGGRTEPVLAFLRHHLGPGSDGRSADERALGAAAYWQGVFREFGPVRLHSVDMDGDPPEFWLRAERVEAWTAFVFFFAEEPPHRLEGYGVRRGVPPPDAPPIPAVDPAELPGYLDGYLSRSAAGDHFSGAVLVARDGAPVFSGAYGLANRAHRVPNHADTRFVIASVGKAFIGVAIARLAEAGRISLDDPLAEYVPEYPERIGSRVTLRHLLTHTSGIELDDYAPYNRAVERAGSAAELLEAQLAHIEHLNEGRWEGFEPLGRFDYTNEGFDLLGVVVERVTGRRWEEYLRQEIFRPAGLARTGFDRTVPVTDLASAYTRQAGSEPGPRRVGRVRPERARPSGSIYSTVEDLARFADALLDGRLLGPEWRERVLDRHVSAGDAPNTEVGYGLGFEVETRDGRRRVGHSGGAGGWSARLDLYPELGYTVVVLSNHQGAARHAADHIGEILPER